MSRIHSPSFWLGAHASLCLVSLMLLPLSWGFLSTFAISGFAAWSNWTTMKEQDHA